MWLGRVRLIGFAALAIMLALAVADRPNLALHSTMPQTVQYFALFFGTGVLAYGLRRQLPVHWAGMLLTGLAAVATNDTRWAEIGQALVLGYGTIYLGSFQLGALGAFTSRQDWSYGVYLVHHVFLTLVLLPAAQRLGLPLPVWFPVFLIASFVLAAVLTAMAAPLGRLLKRAACSSS